MKLRTLLNIIGALSVYNIIVFYIGWNGWVWLQTITNDVNLPIYTIIILLLAYGFMIDRYIHFTNFFKIIGSYWIALVQYSLLVLPIANITALLLRFSPYDQELITFWTGIVTLITFTVIFTYGAVQAYSPIIRKYEITIPKQSKDQQSLRIAMASDMHFGLLSGRAHAQRLVDCVNKIKPDLILLAGDIVDDDPKEFQAKKMDAILKQMDAPLGKYGVLGNHEYYGKQIPEFVAAMKEINITILQDEIIQLENNVTIVGRKDKTDRKRQSIEELLQDTDKNTPIILLDHQPLELEQAMNQGVDISLSGHTHRRQMWPNHIFTRRIFELDYGYKHKNQLHAFVSSGFGFWGPPVRLGSRSEVLQIDIKFIS
ncbi:metallophosphoesterase [Evansella sp. AB-rgal1]|uniref:metallophosphoesterase n=1 Tax=Evansella sp. AB-rgal1 TaxID=3242696 RepID=UPI00359F0295